MNALQYGHQVAQKIITLGLPAITSGKTTVSPAKSLPCQAGAGSPVSTAEAVTAQPRAMQSMIECRNISGFPRFRYYSLSESLPWLIGSTIIAVTIGCSRFDCRKKSTLVAM
jgi:hypothetical protein